MGDEIQLKCQFGTSFFNDFSQTFRSWSRASDGLIIVSNIVVPRYTITEDVTTGQFDLTISDASYESENTDFICQAQYNGNNYQKSATVTVLRKPKQPTISAVPSFSVNEGTDVALRCESYDGSPPPNIVWTKYDGTEVEGEYVAGKFSNVGQGPTSKTIQVNASRADNGQSYICTVWNKVNANDPLQETSPPFTVQYRPDVVMKPDYDPLKLELGSRDAALTCDVDANPSSVSRTWYHDGNTLNYNGESYALNPVQKEMAGIYKCLATNNIGSGFDQLEVQVLYGPILTVDERVSALESTTVTLTCNFDANPTPSKVEWWKDGGMIFQGSELTFNDVMRDQAGNYTCEVTNYLDLSESSQAKEQVGRATTYLEVQYAPGAASITPLNQEALVNGNVTMHCYVTDPGVPMGTFYWKRKGEDFYIWSDATYTMISLTLADSGEYECLVTNSIGGGAPATVNLVVNQSPQIIEAPEKELVANSSNTGLSVTCTAQGKPAPVITWLKDNVELTSNDMFMIASSTDPVDSHISETDSRLSWEGTGRPGGVISKDDTGSYECRASGAGPTDSRFTHLTVNYMPVGAQEQDKFAFDVGTTATVVCQFRAVPAPSFAWSRDGAELHNDTDRITVVTYARPELGDLHESHLLIDGMHSGDVGEYSCRSDNMLGGASVALELQLVGKPDPPANLNYDNVTHDSVYLTWDAGFDGGAPQVFLIVYQMGSVRAQETIEAGSSTEFVITDLSPMTTYSFYVAASNTQGVSEPSNRVAVETLAKPVDPNGVVLTEVGINEVSKKLTWTASPAEPQACVRVETQDEEGSLGWETYRACEMINSEYVKVDSYSKNMNIRTSVCMSNNPDDCGVPVLAEISFHKWILILLCCLGALALVIIITVVVCCCCCRKKKVPENKVGKDYEMETPHVRHVSPPRSNLEGISNKALSTEYDDLGPPSVHNGVSYYHSPNVNSNGPPPAYNGNRSSYHAPPLYNGSTQSDIYKPDPWDADPYCNDDDMNRLNSNNSIDNPYLHISGLPDPYDYDDYSSSRAPSTNVTYDQGSVASGQSTPHTPQRKVIHEVIV
ncbi:PREDICTED: protein turtle-like isoform X2 [Priapulus caudatus]|nr:PREDICTED: protein turtle-like isoform X2 [Priapulus caudatus]